MHAVPAEYLDVLRLIANIEKARPRRKQSLADDLELLLMPVNAS